MAEKLGTTAILERVIKELLDVHRAKGCADPAERDRSGPRPDHRLPFVPRRAAGGETRAVSPKAVRPTTASSANAAAEPAPSAVIDASGATVSVGGGVMPAPASVGGGVVPAPASDVVASTATTTRRAFSPSGGVAAEPMANALYALHASTSTPGR